MRNDTPDRIVGRDREIAQLGLALGSGTDGLRFAMLTGPSGLGKTTLHGALLETAHERGFRTVSIDGRAGALSTPFAPWREALPELASALDASATGGSVDLDHIGTALVAVLAEITAEQPVLLSFDDAQALDESSLALIGFAAGVSERMNMTLLIVEQTDAIGVSSSYRAMVDGLLARRIVQRLELEPLSDDSTRELVAHVLELEDPAKVPAEIVLRSGGNPWFAKELASAYQRGDTEIPVNIAAAATSRLHSLADSAQDLVSAAALCPEGAHIGWLEALAGEKPRQFVKTYEAIVASGLVREDSDMVTIAHPLMQQALLDELSAAMKRALHLEIAEVAAATPTNEVLAARAEGYHLAQAGKSDEAVACFLRSAEANEVAGQLHEAAADYAAALDSEPRVERRTDLLKKAAFAAMEIGTDRASDYWNELGRIAAAQNDNETYAYALFQQYWTSFDGTAKDRLERAAALGPEQYGWSARAAALMCTLAGDYEGSVEHDRVALKLAQVNGDAMLEAMTLEKLGTCLYYLGAIADATMSLREAVRTCVANRYHGWALSAWSTLCLCLSDNLETEQALDEISAAGKYVDDLQLDKFRSLVRPYRIFALTDLGRLTQASKEADEAWTELSSSGLRWFAETVALARANAAVEMGDISVADGATAIALDLARSHGYASFVFEAEFMRARHLATAGNIGEAVEMANRFAIDEDGSMAYVAHWLARTGHQVADRGVVERGVHLAQAMSPRSLLAKLRCDEVVALADEDVPALEAIAARWQSAARVLDEMRTYLSIGLIHSRAGRREEALAALQTAKNGLSVMGSVYDADLATSALRALGTRSRAKSRVTETGNLTKRELQIARLVASGLRNAEVAQQLFLAEKTVAAHLSNIYGKVGVNSRVQLASWLQANDATQVAV